VSQSAGPPAQLDLAPDPVFDRAQEPHAYLEPESEPTSEPEQPDWALVAAGEERDGMDEPASRDHEPHLEPGPEPPIDPERPPRPPVNPEAEKREDEPAARDCEPTVEPELLAWALGNAEAEAEREDELAALETHPDELEPESDVPLGEPLPAEPNVTSWFDTPTQALPTSDHEAMEREWLPDPEGPELQMHETVDTSRGDGPAGSVFAPGPVTELDLPHSELELDILIGRLAGTQLGEDESLMSWFDAKLPGAPAATEAEPAPDEAPDETPARSLYTDDGAVGGWVIGEPQEAWSIGEPATIGQSEVADGVAAPPQAREATARHSIDPFAGSDGSHSRSWGRNHAGDEAAGSGSVEVSARPDGRLLLPGTPNRDT
jgi:hypothetical protein